MSIHKHTSGPWRVCPTDETCIEHSWNDTDETAQVIGHIDDADDAHLVAAAPDMLDLLMHLTWPRGYGNGLNERLSLGEHAEIQALIAKARGQK